MNQFRYIARDRSGTLTRGTHSAVSPQSLQSLLESTGLSLVSYTIGEPSVAMAALVSDTKGVMPVWWRPRGRAIELALTQLAMMLRSGLDLRSSLQTCLEQTTSIALARALRTTLKGIENGQTLQAALQTTKAFPELVVQLVGVGEATGHLSQVLQQASEHLARRRVSLNTVRAALAYPTVVAVAAMSIAIYLIVSVIPELQKMLSAMGRKLPRMTQSLVDLSVWLQANGTTCLALFFAVGGALIAICFWPPGRLWLDRFLLRLPLIGSILKLSGTAALASSLSLMIRSGTRLVEALAIVERLQGNQALAMRVQRSRRAIMHGEGLSRELAGQPGYAPMLGSMLQVAERTGQLEQSLDEVATYCDGELQSCIKRLSLLVEPAIIVCAGVIVGYVYMAFFMALMSAGGNIR